MADEPLKPACNTGAARLQVQVLVCLVQFSQVYEGKGSMDVVRGTTVVQLAYACATQLYGTCATP
jgi:hypothetical protein